MSFFADRDPREPLAITRRDYLKKLTAASLAAWAGGEPLRAAASDSDTESVLQATADSCILLWMAGGMAAPETFDPKRYAPYQTGMDLGSVLSTFPAIDTALDGVQFCQGLEEIASIMDRGTLIRSAVQPDLGSILHSRHQYHWHTGYVPPQTVAAPHLGAWIAKVLGPINPVIPAFINIGQRLEGIGEKEELKAFTTAGFFGSEYGPMNLPFPELAARSVQPPEGMTPGRFSDRQKFYQRLLETHPLHDQASDHQRESLLRSMDKAYQLLSSKDRDAFDLSAESPETRQIYDTSRFGRGCLLARRLVERGARFVEVTTEYEPFMQWDTHAAGHETTARLHREIDRPIAQLIRDLDSQGRLDRTLVIVASEFSRDAMMEGKPGSNAQDQADHKGSTVLEPKHYGLHRHFTGGSSVLLFGGGMRRGYCHGRTADERPLVAIEKPVTVTDLHATLFTALGISPKTEFEVEGRPFYATEDGKGTAAREVFA
ncbi:hypothetical protein HNR46_000677 [Haloferula luteola]|uniref:DUF1501 domain-containing protein n=1 Tax=Haloferula luteola TaxID=595692 RepID=A0A840UZM9_9BACT|nr:DUF1501 domain-containing protein [Haloferula luteola]MBB5350453.1 hypothetical protein [Haloferula luteola]